MIVTDLKYNMENALVDKLNFLCKRCTIYKHQNVILTDGMEGYGKSTISSEVGYYSAYTMRRPLKLFFDPEILFKYAINSEEEVLIWDDAAIAALSMEHYTKIIVKLIKLLLLARKKRHTYIFNIQEMFRMKEPIVSRAIALLHVYSRNELEIGRFTYYDKKSLIKLFDAWSRNKKKLYKSYYSIRGTFPDAMTKIFDEKEYDLLKDKMIMSIDKADITKKESITQDKLKKLRYLVANIPDMTNAQKASIAKVSERLISQWKLGENLLSNEPDGGVRVSEEGTTISTKGYIEPINKNYLERHHKRIIVSPIIVKKPTEMVPGLW